MTAVVNRRKHTATPQDVYIGRPSKWGNPFVPPGTFSAFSDVTEVATVGDALERYEAHVRSRPDLMAALPELEGKNLVCWCAPGPCHGDVLVKLLMEFKEKGR